MTVPSWRLLPLETAAGPINMASDEALLQCALRGQASLRFYQWTQPTLSLGYFQAAEARRADERLAHLDWLRRASGGGAIVHHFELTYALALPAGEHWQPRGLSWAQRFHAVIAAALHRLGAPVELASQERGRGAFLCFEHHTIGDLLLGQSKVVGSAQRRRQGALLQHGSILLRASPFTPHLKGLQERCGRYLGAAAVAAAVVEQLPQECPWPVTEGQFTAEDRAVIEQLARDPYGAASWNARR